MKYVVLASQLSLFLFVSVLLEKRIIHPELSRLQLCCSRFLFLLLKLLQRKIVTVQYFICLTPEEINALSNGFCPGWRAFLVFVFRSTTSDCGSRKAQMASQPLSHTPKWGMHTYATFVRWMVARPVYTPGCLHARRAQSSSRGLVPREPPNPLFRIRRPITRPVDVSSNHLMAKYERELETEKHQSRSASSYSTHAAKNASPKMFRWKKLGRQTGHHPPVFLAVMTSRSTLPLLFSYCHLFIFSQSTNSITLWWY